MALSARTLRALSAFAICFAVACAAVVATGAARAADAPPQPAGPVIEHGDHDYCDEWDEDWNPETGECEHDDDGDYDPGYGDGDPGEYNPSPGDTYVPTDPTGPTGPVEPLDPTIYWPRPPKGAVAKLRANGRTAVAPKSAPAPVKKMIRAANALTRKPYKWGGGHGKWVDRGYDCSGATSYVLRAGGQLSWPMVSGTLAKWGKAGKGRWIQIYANKGHVFMVIAGLRFDTSGYGERGPRWRTEPRGVRGFKLRHPAGL